MPAVSRVPLEGQRCERVERSTKTANATVAGTVPGLRYVFLTDYLLAECDEDDAEVEGARATPSD